MLAEVIKRWSQTLYRKATSRRVRSLIGERGRFSAPYKPVRERLLYVASSALPYHISGYSKRTHEVLCALKKANVDLKALTRPGYPWDCKDSVSLPASLATDVDGVVYKHVRKPSNFRPLALYAAQASRVIESVAGEEKVACIHAATNFLNALPALIAARRLGIPFQYEMRGLWELTRISRIRGYEDSGPFFFGLEFEGIVASEADRLFVISEQLGRFAEDRWGIPADRIFLLPNCVDPESIFPADASQTKPWTVGYAGALVGYEGLDTLIDAIDVLAQKGSPVKVEVIGDGEVRAQLEAQVDRLGLRDRVTFFGRVPPAKAQEILGGCSVVCIPRKPFKVCEIVPPLKLVEALAMGKPVIVPDLPVFRDELGDGASGWFFRSGDANDLARVIEMAFGDSAQREKKAIQARRHALGQRSWADHVTKVVPLCG